jgi:hypothetical protein
VFCSRHRTAFSKLPPFFGGVYKDQGFNPVNPQNNEFALMKVREADLIKLAPIAAQKIGVRIDTIYK